MTAIGTNVASTVAMIKSTSKQAMAGENPIVASCRRADVIIGPVGIVISDSLWGKVTPAMALAVGRRCDLVLS